MRALSLCRPAPLAFYHPPAPKAVALAGRAVADWLGKWTYHLGRSAVDMRYNPARMRWRTIDGREFDLEDLAQASEERGDDGELVRALFTAGDYERVVSLCREDRLADSSYYGTLALARTLFILGDYPGALEEWERYPFNAWKEECQRCKRALDIALKSGLLDHGFLLRLMEQRLHSPGKYDSIASLICLREVMGRDALDDEEKMFLAYPLVHECVVERLGTWDQALVVLDESYGTAKRVQKLVENFKARFKPTTTPEEIKKRYNPKSGKSGLKRYLKEKERDFGEWVRFMDEVRELWTQGRFLEAAGICKAAYEGDSPNPRMKSLGVADCYLRSLLLAGEFGQYVQARRSGAYFYGPDLMDPYLNALLLAGDKLRDVDWLSWDTPFLNNHRSEVREYVHAQLAAFEARNGVDVLRHVVRANPSAVYTEHALEIMLSLHWIYRDSMGWIPDMFSWGSNRELVHLGRLPRWEKILRLSPLTPHLGRIYRFNEQPEFKAAVCQIEGQDALEGENCVRASMGVPLRGEGWVSQREVFVILQKELAPLQVLAEASPAFLVGLRYDVYVPELRLAVEYQGIQHYEPVEAFGGEDALQEVRERDAAKARLSEQNGITLEYIRYDEDLKQRCQEIVERYRPR